ncbi:very low-density lipoprotein receptor-like [Homalodisca vitripennis]|uniref:very low-density lipoprotein receptor-like n=1 Tax=Homalodisca vitripennis TaxID=197043 RepID=UPI001EEA6516|nr:very low-density lipoprotein receptor-like [Homalodisca vitripennis]
MVLEVKDISTSRPLQWVDLPKDSRKTYLTGLLPDKFLSLTLKQVLSTNPLQVKDILSKTIFTGGCIARPPHNLTRTLDIFFPSTIVKSRWGVHCYADDEVFFGYPCRNSDDCIPRNWMCDGDNDCPDGDDERDCGLGYQRSPQCRKTEFRCLKRRENVCLPIKWLCDGRHDCSDGWDEEPRNCRSHYSRPGGLHYLGTNCRDSYFRCHNSLGCVAPKFVCDGDDDCADGSDEWNCPSDDDCDSFKEFQCFQSWGKDRCIPRSWMCDDQEDCDRGEDEHFDICRRVL